MTSNIEDYVNELLRHANTVDLSVRPLLQQVISLLSDARSSLGAIDDPKAREALELCSSAYDQVGNAVYGSLNQYVVDAQQLSKSLQS